MADVLQLYQSLVHFVRRRSSHEPSPLSTFQSAPLYGAQHILWCKLAGWALQTTASPQTDGKSTEENK